MVVTISVHMRDWTTAVEGFSRKGVLTRFMIADVRVVVTPGAEKLVVGLKTRQLLLLLAMMTMMLTVRRRGVGMDVRTTARAVETDQ